MEFDGFWWNRSSRERNKCAHRIVIRVHSFGFALFWLTNSQRGDFVDCIWISKWRETYSMSALACAMYTVGLGSLIAFSYNLPVSARPS